MAEAYDAYLAGALDAFYAPLVVDDTVLEAGPRDGTLRDRHPSARHSALARLRRAGRAGRIGRLAAAIARRRCGRFAAEYSALGEADLGASFGDADRRAGGAPRPARAEAPWRASAASQGACGRERARSTACWRSCRRGGRRVVLFVVALGVFWFQALGWPMAKGRDTWDYLVYYLQLVRTRNPPLSQVQLFRTPLTPIVVGLPLATRREPPARDRLRCALRRHGRRVERDRADVRAGSRAGLGASLLLVYPAWANDLSPGVERRRVRHRPVALGARARPGAPPAEHRGVRRARRGDRGSRPDPAREPGAAPGGPRAACSPPRRGAGVSPGSPSVSRRRSCRSPAGPPTTASATTTRPSRGAGAPGCRSSGSGSPTGRSRRRTALRRGGSPI